MQPIDPQPGSTIDPRNAVGRRAVGARARRELLRGNNLSLTDPRRMGKTVWLDLFCADPGDGLLAVKIDYEGVQTTAEFLTRTVSALRGFTSLPHRARQRLGAFFSGWDLSLGAGPVSITPALAHRTPLEVLTLTVGEVGSAVEDGRLLVVAMDEVPVAIDNIAANEGPSAAGQLLQTLRGLRRGSPALRWIVCGSVGFHHVLRRCDTTEGVVNDLVNLPLGPFAADEALELGHRLALGIERPATPAVVNCLAVRSGRIPFLMHALAHRLEDSGTGDLTEEDVDQAFADFVNDRDDSRAVTHLVTRLAPQYGDRARSAERVLDQLAMSGPLAPSELALGVDALELVLDDLVDDHYLQRVDGRLLWRYDVLRVIWIARRRLS